MFLLDGTMSLSLAALLGDIVAKVLELEAGCCDDGVAGELPFEA